MAELLTPTHLIVLLAIGAFVVAPFWTLFKKAGFTPWLSLLMPVPGINLILLWVVALSRWKVVPIEKTTSDSLYQAPQ